MGYTIDSLAGGLKGAKKFASDAEDAINGISRQHDDAAGRTEIEFPKGHKILATITGKVSYATKKYKYAWTEKIADGTGVDTLASPRSGTTSEEYALNLAETNGRTDSITNYNGVDTGQTIELWCVVDKNGNGVFYFDQVPRYEPDCPCDINDPSTQAMDENDPTNITAEVDTWNSCDTVGGDTLALELTFVSRVSYAATSPGLSDYKFYAFYRTATFDSTGRICSVSAETRKTVFNTEECDPP